MNIILQQWNLRNFSQILFFISTLIIFRNASALDAPPALIPPGLNVGDQFYVMFVTSTTTNATSSDMADYDQFVNTAADGSTVPGVSSLNWKAVGATNLLNQCKPFFDGLTQDMEKPVYLVNGILVDDLASGLYVPYPVSHTPINSDESGNPYNDSIAAWAFTGCHGDGSSPDPLGTANPTNGNPASTHDGWIEHSRIASDTSQFLYAVSPLLTVGAPTPAPTSIPTLSEWAQILLALSLMGMAGWYWQRRSS